MERIRVTWAIRILALTAGGLCAGFAGSNPPLLAQGADELVMVANKSNAPAASMTKGDAKKLLLGQTSKWSGGVPVIVVLTPAGSAERTQVLSKICGMNESDFTRYQLQIAFTGGTAATLHEEHSVAGVSAFVKGHPGAVGFLHKSEAGDDLKTVLTLN